MEAVKNSILQLTSQANNNWQRLFYILDAGNNFGEDITKMVANFLNAKEHLSWSQVAIDASNVQG